MKTVFFGTTDFATGCLHSLLEAGRDVVGVVTNIDKPANRGMKMNYSAVKEYCLQRGIKPLQPQNLKDETFLQELSQLNADVFIVVAFRMLPKEVYSMPSNGTFNLHASLLPAYRGAAPINWAVIRGEKVTGLTTFLLNDRIDEGEILMQRQVLIENDETAGELYQRMIPLAGEMILATLDLMQKPFEAVKQSSLNRVATSAPKIFPQDTFIDWNRGGEEIVNFVRGLSPLPAARTEFLDDDSGERIVFKVFSVKFVEQQHRNSFGTLEITDRKEFRVYCPNGYLLLLDLQQAGKKRMKISDFLNGNKLRLRKAD